MSDQVPRILLERVLQYGWDVHEPFHPFGTCGGCGASLWPVNEREPDGRKVCQNCGLSVPGEEGSNG